MFIVFGAFDYLIWVANLVYWIDFDVLGLGLLDYVCITAGCLVDWLLWVSCFGWVLDFDLLF